MMLSHFRKEILTVLNLDPVWLWRREWYITDADEISYSLVMSAGVSSDESLDSHWSVKNPTNSIIEYKDQYDPV
jgi:hypothetical protein